MGRLLMLCTSRSLRRSEGEISLEGQFRLCRILPTHSRLNQESCEDSCQSRKRNTRSVHNWVGWYCWRYWKGAIHWSHAAAKAKGGRGPLSLNSCFSNPGRTENKANTTGNLKAWLPAWHARHISTKERLLISKVIQIAYRSCSRSND